MQHSMKSNRFQYESCLGIPLILMPQWPSLSRTHHSVPYSPDTVIEDLAQSRDLWRNERMQQNPDLGSCALASQAGDMTGQVEQSEQYYQV